MVVGRDGAAKFTDYFVGFSKLDAQRANGMIQFALRSSALFAQRLTERLPDAFEDEMAFLIEPRPQPSLPTRRLQGRIELSVSTIPPTLQQIREGKLRALGTMSDRRNEMLPEIPTLAEAGVPGCEAGLWTAVVVPAGTPAAIVKRLNETVLAVAGAADVQQAMKIQGVDPEPGTPESVSERIKADIAKWKEVVAAAKIIGAQ
jgi:hypothetical protein